MSSYPSCHHNFADPNGYCPTCRSEETVSALQRELAKVKQELVEAKEAINALQNESCELLFDLKALREGQV